MLDATEESVSSALKRARATIDGRLADTSNGGGKGEAQGAGLRADSTTPPNNGSSPASPMPWNALTWTP